MSFAAEWTGRVAPKALPSRPKVKVRRAMMATLGMTLRLLPLLLLERWWRSRNLAMFKSMFDSQWPNFQFIPAKAALMHDLDIIYVLHNKECLTPISKQCDTIQTKKSVSTDIVSKYHHEKDFSSDIQTPGTESRFPGNRREECSAKLALSSPQDHNI